MLYIYTIRTMNQRTKMTVDLKIVTKQLVDISEVLSRFHKEEILATDEIVTDCILSFAKDWTKEN